MTTVTGLTADRMLAIEAASVVDGDIDGNNLILTKHDGSQINAGDVRGPMGPPGPIGSDHAVLVATSVLEVGLLDQIRAGRQLTAADFTNMGLSAPIGLWNLSDLTDASGNGRALLNKGAIPFTNGINGLAATAARFSGSAAQALYIADSGAADPFRIKMGSWGCWFKTAKRGQSQALMSKMLVTNLQGVFQIFISAGNVLVGGGAFTANGFNTGLSSDRDYAIGITDVCDNRWHFVTVTYDGTALCLYVDGSLEAMQTTVGLALFAGNSPFNIGGAGTDAATANANPYFGRVDEAFVMADVLSEIEIRNLYCAKIAHGLGVKPTRASINVIRRRRGAALIVGDFPVQPLRLHNFSAASLGDTGSNNVGLTNNGAAISVAGADGTNGNAFGFTGGQSLSGTDAGLPSALTARSYGCWVKSASLAAQGVIGWGTLSTGDARIGINNSPAGQVYSASAGDFMNGPFISDGQWHHIVIVEDNAATDGLKRKMYVDGRFVAGSTTLNAITLAGANRFRMGQYMDASGGNFTGQIDAAFVTDQALTFEQIVALYSKSAQALPQSPKNPGDHVEGLTTTDVLVVFDTLDSSAQVDLGVAA